MCRPRIPSFADDGLDQSKRLKQRERGASFATYKTEWAATRSDAHFSSGSDRYPRVCCFFRRQCKSDVTAGEHRGKRGQAQLGRDFDLWYACCLFLLLIARKLSTRRSVPDLATFTLIKGSVSWVDRDNFALWAQSASTTLLIGGVYSGSTSYQNDIWKTTDSGGMYLRPGASIAPA